MDWMAWTWPTAIFFAVIATLLITFTFLAIRFPETPRMGILRIVCSSRFWARPSSTWPGLALWVCNSRWPLLFA